MDFCVDLKGMSCSNRVGFMDTSRQQAERVWNGTQRFETPQTLEVDDVPKEFGSNTLPSMYWPDTASNLTHCGQEGAAMHRLDWSLRLSLCLNRRRDRVGGEGVGPIVIHSGQQGRDVWYALLQSLQHWLAERPWASFSLTLLLLSSAMPPKPLSGSWGRFRGALSGFLHSGPALHQSQSTNDHAVQSVSRSRLPRPWAPPWRLSITAVLQSPRRVPRKHCQRAASFKLGDSKWGKCRSSLQLSWYMPIADKRFMGKMVACRIPDSFGEALTFVLF